MDKYQSGPFGVSGQWSEPLDKVEPSGVKWSDSPDRVSECTESSGACTSHTQKWMVTMILLGSRKRSVFLPWTGIKVPVAEVSRGNLLQ